MLQSAVTSSTEDALGTQVRTSQMKQRDCYENSPVMQKNTALLNKASSLCQNPCLWDWIINTALNTWHWGYLTPNRASQGFPVPAGGHCWPGQPWSCEPARVSDAAFLSWLYTDPHSPQACWAEMCLWTAAPCYTWQPEIKGSSAQFLRLFLISSNSSCLEWGEETKLII